MHSLEHNAKDNQVSKGEEAMNGERKFDIFVVIVAVSGGNDLLIC